MKTVQVLTGAALLAAAAGTAQAGEQQEGWSWLAQRNEVETQGTFWNDRYGDGKDRWKTGASRNPTSFPNAFSVIRGSRAARPP